MTTRERQRQTDNDTSDNSYTSRQDRQASCCGKAQLDANQDVHRSCSREIVVGVCFIFPVFHSRSTLIPSMWSSLISDNFSPLSGLVGGMCIGLAAAVLLLVNGDILGASGIVSSCCLGLPDTILSTTRNSQSTTNMNMVLSDYWKWTFLTAFLAFATLILAPRMDLALLHGVRSNDTPVRLPLSSFSYILAGALVGCGTKLGNGCTSGHGICGLARVSLRSLVAVGTFMVAAMVVASIVPHVPFLLAILTNTNTVSETADPSDIQNMWLAWTLTGMVSLWTLVWWPFQYYHYQRRSSLPNDNVQSLWKVPAAIIAGCLFVYGLYLSQMELQTKVFDFLNLSLLTTGQWDPTLAMVMGGGLVVSVMSYQCTHQYRWIPQCVTKTLYQPLVATKTSTNTSFVPDTVSSIPNRYSMGVPPKTGTVDTMLIVGSVCFGLGWGIGGICPGPAILLAGMGIHPVVTYWWPAYIVGAIVASKVQDYTTNQHRNEEQALLHPSSGPTNTVNPTSAYYGGA